MPQPDPDAQAALHEAATRHEIASIERSNLASCYRALAELQLSRDDAAVAVTVRVVEKSPLPLTATLSAAQARLLVASLIDTLEAALAEGGAA